MQELVDQIVKKVGLDEATAKKVADFIAENATEIPKWLGQSGILDKLPGGIGDHLTGLLGGDDK